MAASGKGRGENWEKVALFYEMVEGKCNITYLVLLTTQTGLQKLTGVRGKKNKWKEQDRRFDSPVPPLSEVRKQVVFCIKLLVKYSRHTPKIDHTDDMAWPSSGVPSCHVMSWHGMGYREPLFLWE